MKVAAASPFKGNSSLKPFDNPNISKRDFLKFGAGTLISFLGLPFELHSPDVSVEDFLAPADDIVLGPSVLFSGPRPFNPAPLNLNLDYEAVRVGRKQYPIIWVFLGGGLSHLDTFCINPDAPQGIRSFYSPINTRFEGIKICEKLPLTARLIHQTALLRNIYHNQGGSHDLAAQRIFSSSEDQIGNKPKYTPYVVRLQRHYGPNKLGYTMFDVSGSHYEAVAPGEALKIKRHFYGSQIDDDVDIPYRLGVEGNFDGARHEQRMGLANVVDRTKNLNHPQIDRMNQYYITANSVLAGRISNVFDLSKVDARIRDEYGRTAIGNAALVAKRMIEAGAPQILLKHSWWDSHNRIKIDLDKHLPPLDLALSALIKDLKDSAIVVVLSEFGRTPRINEYEGRDHWSDSSCMLIAGPTISPCVTGKIDNGGHIFGPDGKYQAEYLGPTVLKAAGIELVDKNNPENKMPYYPIFKTP